MMRKTDNGEKCDKLINSFVLTFVNFLYGSTDCYFLTQVQDCGAIIKVRQNYLQLLWNRIVATIRRRNTAHL